MMEEEINNLKANLLMLTKEQGITMADLSREVGFSNRQELHNLFHRGHSRRDLLLLAEALEVKPSDLVKEVGPEEFARAMADPNDRIKENLKMICAEHGVSTNALREELQYNQPVFKKAFRRNNPRMDIVEDICNHFEIDEEELTGPVDFERYGEALIPRRSN